MLRHQTIQHLQGLEVAPELTDITTLIPFLKSMKENLNFKYLKIVADAGYESDFDKLMNDMEKNDAIH